MDKVRDMYSHNFRTEDKLEEFIRNGGWKARKNGRDLPLKIDYKEKSDAHFFQITVDSPKTDWREWIKTIGVIKMIALHTSSISGDLNISLKLLKQMIVLK